MQLGCRVFTGPPVCFSTLDLTPPRDHPLYTPTLQNCQFAVFDLSVSFSEREMLSVQFTQREIRRT